jgi:hypothetical protein
MDDAAKMEFFGGQQREAIGQVMTKLTAKNRQRSGTGAILFTNAVIEDVLKQIVILPHG